jgi:serine/threonine protein kinase
MAAAMAESVVPDRRLLVGRYRLDRLIGRGGMGTVWAAHDEMLGRDVAVKEVVPPPELPPEQAELVRKRALREARAAARIAHPSAVTVYDVIEEDGRPFIVMQLLPPRTLADVLVGSGPLPPARAARIGVDLVEALETAHLAGVLHRDVKPANVLLTEAGRAVLTDFGIATVEDDPTLTTTGMLVGSPAYMPPERARGERPTPASDLWSLGATLFAAVEGQPPFRRDGQLPTLNAVLTELPPPAVHGGPLQPVIAALLRRDPDARPSAEHTRELLLAAVADAEMATTAVDVPAPLPAPLPASPPTAPPASPPTAPPASPPTAPPASPPTAPPASPPAAPDAATPPDGPSDWPFDRPSSAPPAALPVPAAPSGRHRVVLAVAAVVAVLALGGLALAHLIGSTGGGPATAGGSPTPTSSAAGAPSNGSGASGSAGNGSNGSGSSGSGSSGSGSSGSGSSTGGSSSGSSGRSSAGSSGSGGSSSAMPAGFRRYTDPSGFSLLLPTGWTATRKGTDVTFRRPGSRAYLLVPQTTTPAADALVDWQEQERAASPRFPGYQRIRLERVNVKPGWDVADWEFRWTPSGGTLHVIDRNLRVSDSRAYALYWSVPEQDWSARLATFRVIADSFRPA